MTHVVRTHSFEARKSSGQLYWRCALCGKDHEYADQHAQFHVMLGTTALFAVDHGCLLKAQNRLEGLILHHTDAVHARRP